VAVRPTVVLGAQAAPAVVALGELVTHRMGPLGQRILAVAEVLAVAMVIREQLAVREW